MIDDRTSLPGLRNFLDEAEAQSLLPMYGFANWKTALTVLRRMELRDRHGLSAIFSFLMAALGSAADPDRSLVNFERFLDNYGSELFSVLEKNPRVIEIVVTLFSASPFLTEILQRTPDSLDLLSNRLALTERKTIEQFQIEAVSATRSVKTDGEKLDALRRYQRRQFLRIGANDFLGLYDLQAVFSQLSRMAIGLVRACLVLAAQQTGIAPGGFVILAMGKLGGWELNYSSDIDLLFVAKKSADNYLHLAEQLIENIASTTPEGFLYRVDLRLRPWGNDGPLIATLDGYLQYIQNHARLWEKQAFLKARPIAGNLSLGERLRKEFEPFLFCTPADEVRAGIFAMKQRTEEFLQEKGRQWGEVKLGEGSIRDIEFVVQSLQMTHPSVRTRATLKAILRLREEGLLTTTEAHILTDGYNFLRTIEHYLQMIDYRQTYTLPSDSSAIALLARRLGFEGPQAGGQFVESYEQHCRAIRSIFLKYVGKESIKEIKKLPQVSPQVLQHIARMDASYIAAFSPEEIQKHSQLANKLDNESISIVDAEPLDDTRWRVTVVGYDYLGELSLICGLMFVYGLDIIESQAFTYEPTESVGSGAIAALTHETSTAVRSKAVLHGQAKDATGQFQDTRRKIVDVFIVRSVHTESLTSEMWHRYADDLHSLVIKMQAGHHREARGELAKRVGEVFQGINSKMTPLYPIDIEIDNDSSKLYTVLKIGTTDTVGFLYEFSNALAFNHINIARMFVQSIGNRVKDMIYVTDDEGYKITSSEKQRELRAATVLIKHFTHLLPHSPNPEAALLHFREFLSQLFDRPNWPDELAKLEQPEVLDALAKLLGVSNFLWDDFLRMQYSNLFPVIRDVDALAATKDRRQLKDELDPILKQADDWRVALNAFKDREMFRIDMRHILGYTPEFWDFAYGLTDLAEVVVTTAFYLCAEEMRKEYGVPRSEGGSSCPATVFALGKCGGRELGFASDIELMLIYSGKGKTTGPRIISTSDFYEELIRSFVKSIQARQQGIFHIDLQLRPYGKAGSLAVSLEAFQRYFAPQGPAWAYERQALVKMRPITGDQVLGDEVCKLRDEFVYSGEPFNVTAMHAMRERQIRHLVTAGTFNAKYSPGGLVDLEYLVQGLQISYGAANPSLRLTNIRMAMAALADAGILSADDYARLRKAHTFLRWLIDSLRVVRGNTKDVNIPPLDSEEFAFLTRRLRYGSDTNRLQEDLARYPMDIQELNIRLLSTF
jgi:[glutamine synthetase] adenylyltransferase / [glutamine synthetase]-adenylyl-L-tyrosine phosphorylase